MRFPIDMLFAIQNEVLSGKIQTHCSRNKFYKWNMKFAHDFQNDVNIDPYCEGPTSPPMPKPHPSRSTTMPTYQRFLSHDSATSSHPQDAGNGYDNGAFDSRHPPWYGSLRSSRDPNKQGCEPF